MFLQFDVGRDHAMQWSFSVRARGDIVMQFQRLRPPFDGEDAREVIWSKVNEIVGGDLDKRLNGRPSFPIGRINDLARRQSFQAVMADIFDATLELLSRDQ